MLFRPAESSNNIVEFYKRYLLTTFQTNNEKYNEQLEHELNEPITNIGTQYESRN